MRRKIIIGLSVLAAVFFAAPSLLRRPAFVQNSCIGEHYTMQVNGVSIYYEMAGEGKPVVLLHGNGGSHKDLSTTIAQLAEAGYKVYAVDSRGQGANAPVEDYHYADMADDIYELIQIWNEKPALYGWSDGGIIGLLTEIRHPGTLEMLAISGANITPDGLKGFYSVSASVSNAIHHQSLTEMILNEPDISPEELKSVTIPVLVTAGSNDMIREEHTKMIAETLPDAELKIFEGEDHGSYILGSMQIGDTLLEFFREHNYRQQKEG